MIALSFYFIELCIFLFCLLFSSFGHVEPFVFLNLGLTYWWARKSKPNTHVNSIDQRFNDYRGNQRLKTKSSIMGPYLSRLDARKYTDFKKKKIKKNWREYAAINIKVLIEGNRMFHMSRKNTISFEFVKKRKHVSNPTNTNSFNRE
jgi:hypothetical protein